MEGGADQLGQVTQYIYDAKNRVTHEITDPDGLNLITKYHYDGNGNVIERIDGYDSAEARSTYFFYNSKDHKRFEIDGIGAVKEYRYDAIGNIISELSYVDTINPGSTSGIWDVIAAVSQFDNAMAATTEVRFNSVDTSTINYHYVSDLVHAGIDLTYQNPDWALPALTDQIDAGSSVEKLAVDMASNGQGETVYVWFEKEANAQVNDYNQYSLYVQKYDQANNS